MFRNIAIVLAVFATVGMSFPHPPYQMGLNPEQFVNPFVFPGGHFGQGMGIGPGGRPFHSFPHGFPTKPQNPEQVAPIEGTPQNFPVIAPEAKLFNFNWNGIGGGAGTGFDFSALFNSLANNPDCTVTNTPTSHSVSCYNFKVSG